MDADLDLLLIAVYCMADEFLPARPGNARRRISDAEVITLCVAQAMMGVPCDERFLQSARNSGYCLCMRFSAASSALRSPRKTLRLGKFWKSAVFDAAAEITRQI